MKNSKWDKKLEKLRETYPGINNIDWGKILHEEPEVFHSVVGGVIRPKSGKKSKISIVEGNKKIAQLSGTDYSELPFTEALDILCGNLSVRKLAAKTGFPPATFYLLKTGKQTPSFQDMENIARAFNRHPAFFLEYRIATVLSSIDIFLQECPETAVVWYNKVINSKGLTV